MIQRIIAALLALALSVGFLTSILWPVDAPAIVQELRALPEVARVDYSGPRRAAQTIIHIRDYHFVPKDLADLDGLDYPALLEQVEKVQADQLAIIHVLIRHHGIKTVYSEGLAEDTMQGLEIRLDLLNDLDILAAAGQLDSGELALRKELILTVGTPGRLLLRRKITTVRPLEDAQALAEACPVQGGKIVPDEGKIKARRRAMVKNLPTQGLAVVILGGSHDLGPHLPAGAIYIRVTPRSYPE